MMRKYQISSLKGDGDVKLSEHIGPAMPMFESAFSAFARGTLIETSQGPVAIEDLVPGMKLVTPGLGACPLLWIGSMTLVPNAEGLAPRDTRLTRIMADSLGIGRPLSDFMAGPGARIVSGRAGRLGVDPAERVLVPVRNLIDDMNVVSITPPRPVTVYHLCLPRHTTIWAGGLEAETFHPGIGFERNLGPNMLSLLLSFFPHIREPKDFGGLAHPRRALCTADGLELA